MDLPDHILNQIDSGETHPRNHAVIRAIAGHICETCSFYREVLARFDAGTAMKDEALRDQLWRHISELSPEVEGRFRLLLGLVQPDGEMDWELAGWVIYWAQQAGVSDAAILKSFGIDEGP